MEKRFHEAGLIEGERSRGDPSDAGDPDSLGRTPRYWAEFLYARHWDELIRTARRALFSNTQAYAEDIAADLIADVLAGRFPNLPRKSQDVVRYAKGVLRNRAWDANRKESRYRALSDGLPHFHSSPDPWVRASCALLGKQLDSALARLTKREREVVQLHWIDGWSTRDTAAKLNIAQRTVKELLRRARHRLRESLASHGTHDRRQVALGPG